MTDLEKEEQALELEMRAIQHRIAKRKALAIAALEEQQRIADGGAEKSATELEYESWHRNKLNEFSVPLENVPSLIESLERFNKKAANGANGFAKLTLIAENVKETRYIGSGDFERKVKILCNHYSIECEDFRIDGWEPIALLDHTVGLIKAFKNVDISHSFERYALLDGRNCDHCHKRIKRNETVIIAKDGIEKQIGLSCIKDYLGIDPARLLNSAHSIKELSDSLNEFSGFGKIAGIPAFHFVECVAHLVRLYGYKSKKQCADNGDQPTSYIASGILNDPMRKGKYIAALLPCDTEFAHSALDWSKDIEVKNDFDHNMRQCANHLYANGKTSGFLAAIVPMYAKTLASYEQKQKMRSSVFVGSPKDKITFNVKILSTFETSFSSGRVCAVSTVIIMLSDDGDVFKWKASNPPTDCLTAGTRCIMNGTVKEHTEYKGTKQTVMVRCSLEKIDKEIQD